MNDVEQRILAILRDLKPHERIEIIKDPNGAIDSYLVHRSQKIVIKDLTKTDL